MLDVYCQTSVSPTSGRSLAIAQAHGVPTIASDVEGLRSLVDGENWGLRIPHGDPNLLAQSIATLLSSPLQAARMSEAGRSAVLLDHHPEREAERLAEFYMLRHRNPANLAPNQGSETTAPPLRTDPDPDPDPGPVAAPEVAPRRVADSSC